MLVLSIIPPYHIFRLVRHAMDAYACISTWYPKTNMYVGQYRDQPPCIMHSLDPRSTAMLSLHAPTMSVEST